MLKTFKQLIGKKDYEVFLKLLREIGPDSRTHRISVLIAGMLRYALHQITDYEVGSLEEALIVIDEDPYSNKNEEEVILELVDEICEEVGMRNHRISSRGVEYSIGENVLEEYRKWHFMPWED